VFVDPVLRERFGYQEEQATCGCHDICVPDVKLLCVKEITHVVPIPGVNGQASGCRGGRIITSVPFTIESVVVRCAHERLHSSCEAVENEIGLEIVMSCVNNGVVTYMVVNTNVEFTCTEFYSFPDGLLVQGAELREAVRLIDGSCATIIIEGYRILNTDNPRVEIDLKVIDKLWKYENLLVSAIRPYPDNITVHQLFASNFIGSCVLA
jgi:hypothetical protein